jgi:very-short-patch-repair endonuclease
MKTELDALVRGWARRHHGVFKRQWAVDRGATEAVIRRRIASGAWVPLGAAAFLIGGAPVTWRGRLQAAVWDGGDAALVSHGAAAQLRRFPGFDTNPVEILVPKSLDHVCSIADVHESRRFHLVRHTKLDGLPVVAAEPTLVHVARGMRFKRLDWLVDELILGRRVDRLHATFLHLSPGVGGLRGLRSILEDRRPGDPIPESQLEKRFLQLVTERRLPPFSLQVNIPGRDQRPGRVDLLWPDVKLIVELDGRRWHTRRADFERDSRRVLSMRRLGYSTVRITWLMLTEEPDDVCADLLEARNAA